MSDKYHVSGIILTLGGVAFAFFQPAEAKLGFLVAIVGAGLIDPNKIISAFSRKPSV